MRSEAKPRRLNLLVAEDNLPDALLVREAIKMENLPLEIFIASDGEQAINFIANAEKEPNAPKPHALLLDLNLPKIEGLEVLRRVRASDKFSTLPVIVMTSSDSPSDKGESARLGAGYFRKPMNYMDFLKIGAALKKSLDEHGLL